MNQDTPSSKKRTIKVPVPTETTEIRLTDEPEWRLSLEGSSARDRRKAKGLF
jgi:hypothetical protein